MPVNLACCRAIAEENIAEEMGSSGVRIKS
jgi:hypothetical protein